MTLFEQPNGNETSEPSRIKVAMRADTTRSDTDGPVSPWLYIAGALVTLAALYAVNFSMEDSGFALLSYVLAAGGYFASYFLRVRGISLRGLQVPLLTLLGFFFLLSLLFGQGSVAADSPSRNLQIALTWVAILHSYTLSNNAAVLFACVPGMTLIALVCTSNTEIEAQNAFLVFFCAATFLLIHENYLRTQAHTVSRTDSNRQATLSLAPGRRPLLFGSQFALAAGCFLSAIILARATVIPMQFLGERLFPPGALSIIRRPIDNHNPYAVNNNERNNYDIATGPVTATEAPVMEVTCDEELYWRGGTFDLYTGHGFKNTAPLTSLDSTETDRDAQRYQGQYGDPYKTPRGHFRLAEDALDLPQSQMTGSHLVRQHYKVLAPSASQLYGAERTQELDSPALTIQSDNLGTFNLAVPLQANSEYDVVSLVPTSSPEVLRAAPAGPIPPEIERTYLQRIVRNGTENLTLARLAQEWTAGSKTEYDKVKALQEKIAATCNYNLNTPAAPRDKDVVEYFLTVSKQGYCDSFAAALTMLCRYAGVPARMTMGFLHGDSNGHNTFLVKDKDRHMWTEVFFPNVGWVTFDATDGALDVTGHTESSRKRPLSLQAWLSKQGLGPKLIELVVLVLLAYLIKTELIDRIRPRRKATGRAPIARPASNVAILTAYTTAMRLLERRGLRRAANMTTVEFGTLISTRLAEMGIGESLATLTLLHDRYYYSPETAPQAEVVRAQEALRQLQESLKQFKGEPAKLLAAPQSNTA